ncbi:hypothetical protein DRJ16_03865 [Candidatus Woesearchaeota archaeon]|nr:MAG: hypothetical protein DRJ16_03865 [Candidatus Woesearchaeota archaeon]
MVTRTKNADYLKALRAIKDRRIIRVLIMPEGVEYYLVKKRKGSGYYLVTDDLHCTCDSFLFDVILRRKKKYCYHIMAVKLCKSKFASQCREIKKENFEIIFKEILKGLINQ